MRGTRRRTRSRPLIAATMALALLLAACGGDDGDDGAADPAPDATDDDADTDTDEDADADADADTDGDAAADVDGDIAGTIRVSWWGGDTRNEKHNAVNDLFTAAYPDVDIQAEIGDFFPHWERLTVQTAASDVPCVPQQQSRFLMEFAPRGTLKPLDDYIGGPEAAIDVSNLGLLDNGRAADGTLYFIPHGVFFFIHMFNMDLMEQAGLELPEAGWTWDDYFDMLAAAGEALPDGVWAARPRGGDPEQFAGYVAANGQSLFDGQALGFEKELLIEWMERWEELREAGHIMPMDMALEEPDALEESWLAQGRIMVDRKAANQMDAHQVGLDAAPDREGTFDMQLYPWGDAGVTSTAFGSSGWGIGANCPDELMPAALEYINFWNNDPEAADVYASDNGVATHSEAAERQREAAESPGVQRQLELFTELTEMDPEPLSYASGYATVDENLQRAYERVAFGEVSIEQAVDDFFAESEQALREVE